MTVYPSDHALPREWRRGPGSLHAAWGWLAALGVVMVILGVIALGATVIATLATAFAIGLLMIFGGIVETIGAIWARGWSGFLLHLLSGILLIVVGVLFLRAPVDAALAMTLLLACLLLAGGAFRIIAAFLYRFASWGWEVLGGVIDLFLGLLIWTLWPASALWTIGIFLGVALIFHGVNWIALGATMRALRGEDRLAHDAR